MSQWIRTSEQLDMDISSLDDLFVGLEIEYDDGPHYSHVASRFGATGDHYSGNRSQLAYKMAPIVVYGYPDGSVSNEVVTRPVRICELNTLVKPVFDYIQSGGADFVTPRAGLHMTFLTNQHMEISKFSARFLKNLGNWIVRNYNTILNVFPHSGWDGNYTRPVHFRGVPESDSLMDLCDKHSGPTGYTSIKGIRDSNDGRIWGIEIRIPDAQTDFNVIVRIAKFWASVFRYIGKASVSHTFVMTPSERSATVSLLSRYDEHDGKIRINPSGRSVRNMMKYLAPNLEFYGFYDKASIVIDGPTTDAIFTKLLNGVSIQKIANEYGIDRRQVRKIKNRIGG